MLFEHKIVGPSYSGKSSIALGTLERLQAAGVPVAYVLPTKDFARDAAMRTTVPCVAWVDAVKDPSPLWRAVAVDSLNACPKRELEAGLDVFRRSLSEFNGPTQLILVETTTTPKEQQMKETTNPLILLQQAFDAIESVNDSDINEEFESEEEEAESAPAQYACRKIMEAMDLMRAENGTRWLPHQQRVIEEKSELDKKALALSDLIGNNPVFDTLDADEQERLKLQNDIMWQYSEILGARIAAFKS